jgi:hypothetical protein
MMTMHRWMPAFVLAAGLVAGACGSDANKPEDVDPLVVSNGMSGLTSSFSGNLAFQSLRGLSGSFGYTAAAAAVQATAPWVPGAARDLALTAAQRRALLQFSTHGPSGTQAIFPVDVLGKTFVWDTTLNRYVVNPTLTGAPANGVRFVLYLMGDTVLGRPRVPLQTVGSVDLTDLSTALSNKVGVKVKYLSQVIADYTIAGTLTTGGLTLRAQGYLTDGVTRLDFDLATTLSLTTLSVNYSLSGSNGFAATMQVTVNLQTDGGTVLWRVTNAGNTVEVNLTGTGSTVTGQILFNGGVAATVTGTGGNPVITGSGGLPLTAQQLQAVRRIFEGFGELMDQIDGVFGPAHLVFDF